VKLRSVGTWVDEWADDAGVDDTIPGEAELLPLVRALVVAVRSEAMEACAQHVERVASDLGEVYIGLGWLRRMADEIRALAEEKGEQR